MFENIEQLEQEINMFRQNILASNDLIKNIEALTSATNMQRESLLDTSKELFGKMETYSNDVKISTGNAVKEVTEGNKVLVDTIISKCEDVLKQVDDIPENVDNKNKELARVINQWVIDLNTANKELTDKLAEINKESIDEAVERINVIQKEYLDKLMEVEYTLKKVESELNIKYTDFLSKINEFNLGQVLTTCQEMKKNLDSKIMLLSVGMVVTILLLIISIVLR